MGSADALTGSLTPDGNGLRRTVDGAGCPCGGVCAAVIARRVAVAEQMLKIAKSAGAVLERVALDDAERRFVLTIVPPQFNPAPSNLGRAPEAAAAGDPLGVSGP